MRNFSLPLPSPHHSYKTVLEEGFKKFPKRYQNYIKAISFGYKESIIDYLPIKMDFENVSRCNFRCIMCQIPKVNGKRADDMKFEDFKSIIDKLSNGLVEIKLQGLGEPLLGGESFFEMIKYAKSKSIWVRTSTNASLLHIDENYKKLVDSGVDEVCISIDGATKETYEKIRVGGVFEKVCENSKVLNSYAKLKAKRPITRMWVMLQKENEHELLEFVSLAKNLGFQRLTFSVDLHYWGRKDMKTSIEKIRASQKFKDLWNALTLGRKKGIDVTFWYIRKKYDLKNPCPWPFQRAYISSDLKIVPCCMVSNPEIACMGDARVFADVWFGEKYNQFRKNLLKGIIPEFCRSCYEDI